MSGSGPAFYKGASQEHTPFFQNKEEKFLQAYEWPASFEKPLSVEGVALEPLKSWVGKKVAELMNGEDDIVADFVIEQLLEGHDEEVSHRWTERP